LSLRFVYVHVALAYFFATRPLGIAVSQVAIGLVTSSERRALYRLVARCKSEVTWSHSPGVRGHWNVGCSYFRSSIAIRYLVWLHVEVVIAVLEADDELPTVEEDDTEEADA